MDGTSLQISSAISISDSVGAPNEKPFAQHALHGFEHFGMDVAEDHRPP